MNDVSGLIARDAVPTLKDPQRAQVIEVCLQRGDASLGARKQHALAGHDTLQARSDTSLLLDEIGQPRQRAMCRRSQAPPQIANLSFHGPLQPHAQLQQRLASVRKATAGVDQPALKVIEQLHSRFDPAGNMAVQASDARTDTFQQCGT